jgi:hypothetical protein
MPIFSGVVVLVAAGDGGVKIRRRLVSFSPSCFLSTSSFLVEEQMVKLSANQLLFLVLLYYKTPV